MSINDPDFYQAPRFSPEPSAALPRERGCFFYGCIIASILAVLMVILFAVILYVGYRFAEQQVKQYTGTAPIELPKVEMPAEQRESLKDRVESFRKAAKAGTPIEPLVLTSDDLNALIEENPNLKGKIHVKVEGDQVKGQVSIPCDALAEIPLLGMFKGRYLNGEAGLKASLEDGVLIVTLDSFEVNGQRPPDPVMTELRKHNWAKDAYEDEKAASMIRKIESLQIKDGKIILRVRARAGASSGAAAAEKEMPVKVLAPPPSGQPKDESTKDESPKEKAPKAKALGAPAEPASPKS
ncbi:MAG: hypothetical protein ACHRXM_13230 [Isosphaerales bacterium]